MAEPSADRYAISGAIHTARHKKDDTDARERTSTALGPFRVPDNAPRVAETFMEYTDAAAMMSECY